VGPFEEEEERTGVASDVVEVEGEDPNTPDYRRGDRVRLGRWRSRMVGRLPWLAHEAPSPYITIPQYQFNKTKQHKHTARTFFERLYLVSGLTPPIDAPSQMSHLTTHSLAISRFW